MPTSTNLGLVTPASSDFVTSGAVNMQTIANGIDAYFGAPTVYTPSWTGSNISSGAGDFRYRKIGRLGFVIGAFSAGQATAAGSIDVNLPTGWTNVGVQYTINASSSGAGLLYALALTSGTSIRIWANSLAANWTAGQSVANVRFNAVLQLAA